MYYYDVLVDICSQLGDPAMDQYQSRAESHFVRAISHFIEQNAFTPEDLPYYIKLKTNLSFSTNPYDSTSLKILKILDIYPDPAVDKDITVTLIGQDRLRLMAQNDNMKPQVSDVFVYKVGVNIYCLVASASPEFDTAADTLHMQYVEDIDHSSWSAVDGGGTDFQGATYYFHLALFVSVLNGR